MEYRNLGNSGLQVSAISLGSWLTFGNTVHQGDAERVVHAAFAGGVNLFDTADIYNRGEGELCLGRSIQALPRDRLVLATKCFFPMSDDPNDRGLSRKHVFQSIHRSLQRLGTDYVDLYQCHRPDPQTPIAETCRAMDDLIRQGKVLYWGVSCWPPEAITEAVAFCERYGMHPPISNQPPYNLLDRHIEEHVIPTCERHGLGQIVFSPLAQGVLTGKYLPGAAPAADTRAGDERVNQFIGKYLHDDALARVDRLRALAREVGGMPGPLALAWILRRIEGRPLVASAIVGARTVEQLEENLGAAALNLPDAVAEELDRVFAVAP